MPEQAILKVPVTRFERNTGSEKTDFLALEEPLEISILYWKNAESIRKNISITMRTPGKDKELAIGFLFTEGIIKNAKDVADSEVISLNHICIHLQKDAELDLSKIERHFYTTSSCGVCGKSSIDAIKTLTPMHIIQDECTVNSQILYTLNAEVKQKQDVFESTGGLHASALFSVDGTLIYVFEDVGRHNALDKLIGHAYTCGALPLNKQILFLSGRASFELIQKAAMAGIPVVCALGAPSSLAVQLATEFNITLVGFLKDKSFNVYSAAERII